MTNLHEELALAWADRARRLRIALLEMVMAPALFKPEHVEATRDEYHRAQAWTAYWMDGPGA